MLKIDFENRYIFNYLIIQYYVGKIMKQNIKSMVDFFILYSFNIQFIINIF